MSAHAPTQDGPADSARQPAERGTGRDRTAQPLRILGLAAVCVGVAALAAATFVLSYTGIRVVAEQAGITPHHARAYPLLIDAMLVIALSAVLGLRGAGLPSRALAWLTLLVVLAAAAGADALHATGHALAHNAAAVTAAVLPWALVLVSFLLLLALLRHLRMRRQTVTAGHWRAPGSAGRPDALQTARLPADPADPSALPTNKPEAAPIQPAPNQPAQAPAIPADPDGPGPASTAADPGPAGQTADDQEDSDDMPVFHRMWSAPTPPGIGPPGPEPG